MGLGEWVKFQQSRDEKIPEAEMKRFFSREREQRKKMQRIIKGFVYLEVITSVNIYTL